MKLKKRGAKRENPERIINLLDKGDQSSVEKSSYLKWEEVLRDKYYRNGIRTVDFPPTVISSEVFFLNDRFSRKFLRTSFLLSDSKPELYGSTFCDFTDFSAADGVAEWPCVSFVMRLTELDNLVIRQSGPMNIKTNWYVGRRRKRILIALLACS